MKLCVIAWFCLMSAAIAGPSPASTPTAATLRWNNGETITGEPVEASAASLTWKTPLFEDPLILGWHALSRINQTQPPIQVTNAFNITLKDGSSLYGDLVSVTKQFVTIRSARHGEVVLKRSEVLRLQRIRGGDLTVAGPLGDGRWSPEPNASDGNSRRNGSSAGPEIPLLTVGPGGALVMPYWNRTAKLDLTLPELVDVEFRVRSSKFPDFRFSLEGDPQDCVRVETWDRELVLVVSNQFKFIREIADNEHEIDLRLCWDRKARKCSVFTPSGECITEWQLPENKESSHPGVVLQNKGRDLSLDFLRVRHWDGKPPPKIDENQPRIELADGRILEGEVSSGSAEAIALHAPGNDSELSFALKEVDAVIFSAARPQVSEHQATLSYADGTILMGRISAIKDGSAALETSFTKVPLATRLDALRQLLIKAPPPAGAAPEPSLAELDKIVIQQTTLHGKFVGVGDDWPRWLPVGGGTFARPSKTLPSEITRAFPTGAVLPTAPVLFYTSAGDVLPGTLHALDASGVEFESSLMEITKLASCDLDAVQFGAVARMNLQGFNDAGWRILKGDEKTIRRENGSLNMEPETCICHPEATQCNEINFTIDSNSAIRVRLFCSGTDGTKSSNLMLWNMGERVSCGMESSDGQLENQTQARVQTGHAAVRLLIREKQVELFLNDALIQTFSIPPAKRAGTGLIIEPASLWGNTVEPLALSKFSATSEPGCTSLPNVSSETKLQALTVPRFRKDDPPHHVLLGPNGDVLRGEIEATTATHFAFRSGLENLQVPRERVQAAIWLKKPAANSPPPAEKSRALKLLDQMIEQRMGYSNAELKTLIGVLQREAPDLKFKLPEKSEGQFRMQFGGQTIGQALDKICALFGLHYLIDKDDTIILEAVSNAPTDLVQKVYWLKADAFPNTASAQETLAAKGIDFPPGSAALWNPEARQLSMTNTEANHSKLLEVLAADFGGSLGSPTHWLLLTSGARFGLMVDKFDKDSISGRHPVYGRCNVPMSNVYAIRTSMPEPNMVMKLLKDWRLVFAAEPVLPETGGGSPALLGKEAKNFKLPLLGGGDFDLSHEKGKVIVLDFWATWCGPCVRSLPGLLEAIAAFPADRVELIGVNQGEPKQQVKRFLETRGWKLAVAMDADQCTGRLYGIDAIPHTIVIGPDGKIAWEKVGYSPDGEKEVTDAVNRLLAAPSKPENP